MLNKIRDLLDRYFEIFILVMFIITLSFTIYYNASI